MFLYRVYFILFIVFIMCKYIQKFQQIAKKIKNYLKKKAKSPTNQ